TADDRLKYDSANHPDFLAIVSEETILSEKIDVLRQFIYKKPLLATIKAVLIDDVANLNEVAQNKLLKIIEEPPGHAVLLLVTNRPGQLIDTLLSRVVQVNFNPLSGAEMAALIGRHQLLYDDSLVAIADGSFGAYMRRQSDSKFIEDSQKIIDMVLATGKAVAPEWLNDLANLDAYKEDTNHLFYLLKASLRDLLVYAKAGKAASFKLLNLNDVAAIDNKAIKSAVIYDMINSVNRAEAAIERGQNYSLITEKLFFDIREAKWLM
ncbi:MAG: hypothetical protein CSB19_02490, partial [Clostridiales bacterium]